MYGGVTNSQDLRKIADVVDKYEIPLVKMTGYQRIDLIGVKKKTCRKYGPSLICRQATRTEKHSAR